MNSRGPLFNLKVAVSNDYKFKWELTNLINTKLNNKSKTLLINRPLPNDIKVNKEMSVVIITSMLSADDDLLDKIKISFPNITELYIYILGKIERIHSFNNLDRLSIVKGDIQSVNNIRSKNLLALDLYEIIGKAGKLFYENELEELRIDSSYVQYIEPECTFNLLQFYKISASEGFVCSRKRIHVSSCKDLIATNQVFYRGDRPERLGFYIDDRRVKEGEVDFTSVYIPLQPIKVFYITKDKIICNNNFLDFYKQLPMRSHYIASFIPETSPVFKMHYYPETQTLKMRMMGTDESFIINFIEKNVKIVQVQKIRFKIFSVERNLDGLRKRFPNITIIAEDNLPLI